MSRSAGWLQIVVCLLVIHVALVTWSAAVHSVVVDEAAHIASGMMHWQTGGFDAYRVNPPLPRMLAVLPMMASGNAVAVEPWFGVASDTGQRNEWFLSARFCELNAQRYHDLVVLARLMGNLWSIVGGLVVFRWAQELYGTRAGLLGLGLWCFEPSIMAHASLATPDLPAAAAGVLAVWCFRAWLNEPSWIRTAFAGLSLGLALLTKFTMLAFVPVFLGLALLLGAAGRQRMCPGYSRWLIRLAAVMALAWITVNAAYGWEGTGTRISEFRFTSRFFAGDARPAGNRWADSAVGALPWPLPRNYLVGIDLQKRDFDVGFPSYLAGIWRLQGEGGWWYYYLYALGVKLPLGILGLLVAAILLLALRCPGGVSWREDLLVGLPPLVILALVSSQTGFNHHARYVLPVTPFLILIITRTAHWLRPETWKTGILVLLLGGWATLSSLHVYPHCLSYFNEMAGGPENGHAHLVDSNIDWGQDLPFLKRFVDRHPEFQPLNLAYFGAVDPRVYGIQYRLPPLAATQIRDGDAAMRLTAGPQPGYYAVSVNFARGLQFAAPDGDGNRRDIPLRGFEYFLAFTPIARAGYSILIYHITVAQANDVRRRMGLEPIEDQQ
ncbi:MAG: glycosyltransferase family 39 protein [Gemmataceae bacterium]|nr:glycosyltransferase family 39 protein [Gemmataceae bacterium]